MVSHRDRAPDTRAWAETATTFYRRERPDAHFRTSSVTSPAFAEALLALLAEHPDLAAVTEVGAGVGTLLGHLHRRRPDLRCTGVDLRDRPTGLDPAIGWVVASAREISPRRRGRLGHDPGLAATVPTLLVACELLDDVPGDRPALWVDLLSLLAPAGGLALAVDYAPAASAPSALAYRDGQQVHPVVAPDRNLTAPVDLDAVRRAGEAAGARTLALLPQSVALAGRLPDAVATDPLADLVDRSERHALTSPRWLGAHWWLLQRVPA